MSLATQTVFLEHLILHLLLRGVQTNWDDWNLPNKQFQSKSICFSSLLLLSRVNKVIFVWVYKLENKFKILLLKLLMLLSFLISASRFFHSFIAEEKKKFSEFCAKYLVFGEGTNWKRSLGDWLLSIKKKQQSF